MSDTKYLLLLSQRSLKPLLETLESLNAFYTGLGYAIPQKNETLLRRLVASLPDVKIIPMPLTQGQTFESVKHSYKVAYFQEQLLEKDGKLLPYRQLFNFEEITEESIADANHLTDAQKEELTDLLHEKIRLQKQLDWAKGMEKALEASSLQQGETDWDSLLEECTKFTYDGFVKNMCEALDKGAFITGFTELDEILYFSPGDLVILQAMSNHGKSAFISFLTYRFLTLEENRKRNPIVIWITFESSVRMIKKRLLNTISSEMCDKKIVVRDRAATIDVVSPYKKHNDYLFGHEGCFKKEIDLFNSWFSSKSLYLLHGTQTNQLQALINTLKARSPGRPIIMFFDYFQIVRHESPAEGWQKMKELAYLLERFAIVNDALVFAGSQVNDQGDTREGKDIYNACSIDLDIFNHSHPKLNGHEKLGKFYRPHVNGKNVVSLTIDKAKEFECRELAEYLLFDGAKFELNPDYGKANRIVPQIRPKESKKTLHNRYRD